MYILKYKKGISIPSSILKTGTSLGDLSEIQFVENIKYVFNRYETKTE